MAVIPGSKENPICLDDFVEVVPMGRQNAATQQKKRVYLELDSEGKHTELPIEALEQARPSPFRKQFGRNGDPLHTSSTQRSHSLLAQKVGSPRSNDSRNSSSRSDLNASNVNTDDREGVANFDAREPTGSTVHLPQSKPTNSYYSSNRIAQSLHDAQPSDPIRKATQLPELPPKQSSLHDSVWQGTPVPMLRSDCREHRSPSAPLPERPFTQISTPTAKSDLPLSEERHAAVPTKASDTQHRPAYQGLHDLQAQTICSDVSLENTRFGIGHAQPSHFVRSKSSIGDQLSTNHDQTTTERPDNNVKDKEISIGIGILMPKLPRMARKSAAADPRRQTNISDTDSTVGSVRRARGSDQSTSLEQELQDQLAATRTAQVPPISNKLGSVQESHTTISDLSPAGVNISQVVQGIPSLMLPTRDRSGSIEERFQTMEIYPSTNEIPIMGPPRASEQSSNLLNPLLDSTATKAFAQTPRYLKLNGNVEESSKVDHDQTSSLFAAEIAAGNIHTVRLGIEASLKRRLKERYEDHAYLTRNIMWRQRTCFEREAKAQQRGHNRQTNSTLPSKYNQITSPFGNMPSLQRPWEKEGIRKQMRDVSQEIFSAANPRKPIERSVWRVPVVLHKFPPNPLPPFKEYISLSNCVLADNESKMPLFPWLGDDGRDKDEDKLRANLPKRYEIKSHVNRLLDMRNEQCRFYKLTFESFLPDIGISWDTVLFWLLAPPSSIQQINRKSTGHDSFENLLISRSNYSEEIFHPEVEHLGQQLSKPCLFERSEKPWLELLSKLDEPTASQLRRTALACAAFMIECKFSVWYIARQSKLVQSHIQRRTKAVERAANFTFKEITCRVCHGHNCLFHGQLKQTPAEPSELSNENEADKKQDTEIRTAVRRVRIPRPKGAGQHRHALSKDDSDSDDSVHEDDIPAHVAEDDSNLDKVINYRIPTNPNAYNTQTYTASTKHRNPPDGPFKPQFWLQHTETHNWENRKPFVPCNHEGSCISARCRCYTEDITCEKTCRCARECNRRFPGCDCVFTENRDRNTCGISSSCLCAKFNRECDADLCVSCGASEVLDPVNRRDENMLVGRCSNLAIQRGIPKKTLLGQSELHGFGLYAGQDILKDEMIGEYTGELISVEEVSRRNIIYTFQRNMYFFKVNKEQDVDATLMGNKLRFINNANKNLCYPKVLLCNTVLRVALFANADIEAGTEFFFHYGYDSKYTKNFKQPKGKVVAIKQTVKMTGGNKMKTKSSRFLNADISVDGRIAGLAKARAAKAAKRTAALAEQRATRHAPARGTRKIVSINTPEDESSSDHAVESANEESDVGSSAEPHDTQETTSTFVIQETEEEDDDFEPEESQEQPEQLTAVLDDANLDLNDAASDTASSSRSQSRSRRAAKSAALFAVKDTRGGARQGAGRKRKRARTLNNHDS